jgi:hypothetical protein
MNMRAVGHGMPSYAAIAGLLAGSHFKGETEHPSKSNPPSSAIQKEFRAKMQAKREEDRRCFLIRKGVCPSCQGKLTRGKKDKQMEYKRQWVCTPCDKIHYI